MSQTELLQTEDLGNGMVAVTDPRYAGGSENTTRNTNLALVATLGIGAAILVLVALVLVLARKR